MITFRCVALVSANVRWCRGALFLNFRSVHPAFALPLPRAKAMLPRLLPLQPAHVQGPPMTIKQKKMYFGKCQSSNRGSSDGDSPARPVLRIRLRLIVSGFSFLLFLRQHCMQVEC
jgi:hypothetical protein